MRGTVSFVGSVVKGTLYFWRFHCILMHHSRSNSMLLCLFFCALTGIVHFSPRTHARTRTHTYIDKLVFFDVIIEDDSGETEPPEEKIPYQLSKEGIYMDMKVKDLMVS